MYKGESIEQEKTEEDITVEIADLVTRDRILVNILTRPCVSCKEGARHEQW
jgi:hypothetical protein